MAEAAERHAKAEHELAEANKANAEAYGSEEKPTANLPRISLLPIRILRTPSAANKQEVTPRSVQSKFSNYSFKGEESFPPTSNSSKRKRALRSSQAPMKLDAK